MVTPESPREAPPEATPPSIRIEAVEIGVILPLRTEVLRDGQPPESAQFAGDDAPTTIHLAALDEHHRVAGCLSLMENVMPGEAEWTHQLRGMAVAQSHRGRGAGGLLLNRLKQLTPNLNVWCNARVPAQRFYERHGWIAASAEFDIPHHGPHVRMTRRGLSAPPHPSLR